MQIVLRGAAAGYEAEHTARIFFPGAQKADRVPQQGDFVLAQSHAQSDFVLLRRGGALCWRSALRAPGADACLKAAMPLPHERGRDACPRPDQ